MRALVVVNLELLANFKELRKTEELEIFEMDHSNMNANFEKTNEVANFYFQWMQYN
jgi:hypothetical protein